MVKGAVRVTFRGALAMAITAGVQNHLERAFTSGVSKNVISLQDVVQREAMGQLLRLQPARLHDFQKHWRRDRVHKPRRDGNLRSQSCSRCSSTAGRQVDDTSIHAAVSAKLTVDRFSNIVNIDINVTKGVLTLAGEVPNAKVSAEAQSEARSVFGVVKVINNLQVKSPPSA